MREILLLLIGQMAICLFASIAPAQAGRSVQGAAVLQPGDAVRITVWRRQELSGEFVVAADGSIKHPIYQHVKVADVPIATAQSRLLELVGRYLANPEVIVEPLFRVAVGGEVREPKLYSLPVETTVGQAVALAGGATEEGRLDRVRLLRGNREFVGDLTRVDADWARMPIQSGDQIIVPRKGTFFRDFIGPFSSLIGAVATIILVARQ